MESDKTWSDSDLDTSAARFMERVDTSGDCWTWTGPLHKGYGSAQLVGARKHTTAHRVAYMLATGRPIPAGLVVRHACDNPPCVFPGHLLLGTKADNARDMVERGRARHGETGPLPGNASTVHPGRGRLRPGRPRKRPTPAQYAATEHPPVDLEAQAALAARRALYGA